MLAAGLHLARAARDPPVDLGELDGGADLVALALALLLVGGDPVAPPGRDVLEAEQLGQRLLERGSAALAEVGAAALRDRVQVAAAGAQLRALGRQAVCSSPGCGIGRITLLTR